MRWNKKNKPEFIKKSAFLFLPLTINNETRWLEYTSWIERYEIHHNALGHVWHSYECVFWEDDDDPYNAQRSTYEYWLKEQEAADAEE